ncbi:hypothetical protein LOTGIDRAFT_237546 [Lottia gigantea]|uniref:Max-binding protein MNT n=1 Tax=Lottia gigantea TaxID=225164 RepID=V4B9M2_LOTGI|nr:hypothetical protein LOTGIDRAFT_237546 [Lottia gigantea]ESP04131.1 hypothetical protein LOTGIDRAFT_237546 [Lottia gigantea]
MSLDTLLEAAEYIEWSAHSKTRETGSPEGEIMTFIKSEMDEEHEDDGNSSLDGSLEGHHQFDDNNKEKRRAGGAGTRETHNKLEKNRRAHLKECFDLLKVQVPYMEEKKTSNLSILRGALKFIQNLKRKERDLEKDLQSLSNEKCRLREKIAKLKVDLAKMNMDVDLTKWMPVNEQETNSTSTASGSGSPIMSDNEDDKLKRPGRKVKSVKVKQGKSSYQVPMIKSIPVKIIKNPRPLAPATSYTTTVSATTPTMATHIRPPVTQLLQQTLSKRQALQKQREKQTVTQSMPACTMNTSSIVPPVMNQLLRQQLSFPVSSTQVQILSTGLNGSPSLNSKGTKSNMLQSTTTSTTVGVPNALTRTSAAMVSSTRIVPMPSTQSMSTLSALSQLTAVAGLGHTKTVQSSVASPTFSTILSNNNMNRPTNQLITTMVTPSVTSLANMSAIKPILAPPPPTQLVAGHLLNPMIAQFPRATLTSQAGQTGGQQTLVSLAHMGTVTPMAVVPQLPQALHMTGLTPAQFNSIMNSPQILKQLPILHQPLLHQIQQSPVIGQPMVKPVVMVSLPNVSSSNSSMNITTTS